MFFFFQSRFYECPMRFVTGLPCPGCGMTRALHRILHLDFYGAFMMHPLVYIMPILLALFIWGNKKVRKYSEAAGVILFFGVYIIRMILYFPNTVPMDFNYSSLLYKGFNIFKQIFYN